MLLDYSLSEFKSKLKEMSVSELKAELVYCRCRFILSNSRVESAKETRKISYKALQKLWLETKRIKDKRYVKVQTIIDIETKSIEHYLEINKDFKQAIKFIKDELSLRPNL